MKEKIQQLRQQKKSYREIAETLGCSKSLISYHCNLATREKSYARTKISRAKNTLTQKVDKFKRRKAWTSKTRDFQRRNSTGKLNSKATLQFNAEDLIQQITKNPKCYLTGRAIDITDPSSFSLDHKIPVTRGGDNSLENLGVACAAANISKSNLTIDEFIQLCKDVVITAGYQLR